MVGVISPLSMKEGGGLGGAASRAVGTTGRVADERGFCVCPTLSYRIGDSCVLTAALLPAILCPVFVLLVLANYLIYLHHQAQKDLAWKIARDEIVFSDPPDVLGRGTFGLVVKATFRNTPVAVKRVLPSTDKQRTLAHSTSNLDCLESSSEVGNSSAGGGASSQNGAWRTAYFPSDARRSGRGGRGLSSSRPSLSSMRQEFVREMRTLAHLRHPHIISLMGAVLDERTGPLLVMELMELGSLWDLLRNQTLALDGSMMLPIVQGVARGLSFLHASRPPIVHGDVKSSNVLVSDKFQGKISDLGLSQKGKLGYGGTPYWTAPECLAGEPNSSKSDVYSFGVTLWEVMAREEPYAGEDAKKVLEGVRLGTHRPRMPDGCGFKMAAVMAECWVQDPRGRPDLQELERRLEVLDPDEMISSAWVKSVRRTESVYREHPTPLSAFPDNNPSLGQQYHPAPAPPQTTARAAGARSRENPVEVTVAPADVPSHGHGYGVGIGGMSEINKAWLRCFPEDVAGAMARGEKVPPAHKDMVSVYFSDVVGFTDLSSRIGPLKVSAMLDRLYSRFDASAESLDVFNIETIGDAYLCATNLRGDQADSHAARLARFAVEAVAAARATAVDLDDPSLGFVNIRVGICSGPVPLVAPP